MPLKLTAILFGLFLLVSPAAAHFPWLATNDDGHTILFFGESPAERDYHLPEAVERAEVVHVHDSQVTPVALSVVESDVFTGRRADGQTPRQGRLATTMVYGVYHGTKLTYYSQHELSLADEAQQESSSATAGSQAKPGSASKTPASHAALHAELTRTVDGGVAAQIFWKGKPLADAAVQLFCDEGHVEGKAKTDPQGRVHFTAKQVEPGLNGLMVGHVVKGDSGTIGGQEYTSASHYLTVTFHNRASEPASATKQAAVITPLPEPITSFGAAVVDGWLYVYGGHTGKAHVYSRETLSEHFVRIRVDGSSDWEPLPMDQPLQGLAMVSHRGKIYRIGGLDTRNAPGEADDLHSVSSFACFDPTTNQWAAMPSLPNARSSHNAVVLGDTLYVVGGWQLSGDREGAWQAGAIAYDLTQSDGEWRTLPEPPFRRRALAVGHVDNQVVVVGGMNEDLEVTRSTYFFDPTTSEWTPGPELPGDAFHGFGLAAWNIGGVLYTGGMEGVLYRLDQDRSAWIKATDFATPRFFHQLVPAGDNQLLAIAGAASEGGHLATVEVIEL